MKDQISFYLERETRKITYWEMELTFTVNIRAKLVRKRRKLTCDMRSDLLSLSPLHITKPLSKLKKNSQNKECYHTQKAAIAQMQTDLVATPF